jgi:hypothetical protein
MRMKNTFSKAYLSQSDEREKTSRGLVLTKPSPNGQPVSEEAFRMCAG